MEHSQVINVTLHQSKKGYKTKMDGIMSISTLSSINRFCQGRHKSANAGCICKLCFADKYIKMRPSLERCLKNNYYVLKERVYSDNELLQMLSIPLTTVMVRIEAFGDVDNMNQVLNYLHIIKLHPYIRFAIWSKNYRLWAAAFEKEGKPTNCRYIQSSPIIGVELNINRFPFADSVFTVYPKRSDDSDINCGARSCAACKKCYFGSESYIRERLK